MERKKHHFQRSLLGIDTNYKKELYDGKEQAWKETAGTLTLLEV